MTPKMLVAVVGCALAVPAATALASRDDIRTHSTIKLTRVIEHDTFAGRVKSVETACVRNRRIKLVYEARGAEKVTFAKLRSNRKGRWRYRIDDDDDQADPGTWQVVVRRTKVRSAGAAIICMRGKSDRVPIN